MAGKRDRPEALLVDESVAAELVEFVREARAAGRPVGLAARVDAVPAGFDVALDPTAADARKPSREFFLAACLALGRTPDRCLFVDTDVRSINGARAAGLAAFRWSGPGDASYLRSVLDL